MALNVQLSVLGFGNMGGAIVRGLIETGVLPADSITVFDTDEGKCVEAAGLGVLVALTADDAVKAADVVLLAVKPQVFQDAVGPVRDAIAPDALVVSVMAGVSTGSVQELLGEGRRVVRVMPNLPALVGAGASAVAAGANASGDDVEKTCAIFQAVGVVECVPEDAMDAITALSGSGPAYFFRVVECLAEAAAEAGLPRDQAERLAAQTLLGAGILLRDSTESAATLRERVTSKGGTTEAALKQFEADGLSKVIAAGFRAAAERSRELGK